MSQSLLFADSAEQKSANRRRGMHTYAARLAGALGDGREWEYRGECCERARPDGICACGHHGLRYEFRLHHKTSPRTLIVGSSCIETFHGMNPETVEAIRQDCERLEQWANERKRAARRLATEKEIEHLLAEFSELAWKLDAILATGAERIERYDRFNQLWIDHRSIRRTSRDLYFCWHSPAQAADRLANRQEGAPYPYRWKQYKSASAFKKHIKEKIASVKRLLTGRIWETDER